jgi:hypothetical protein
VRVGLTSEVIENVAARINRATEILTSQRQ